jgi:signal transduction histidine kinase
MSDTFSSTPKTRPLVRGGAILIGLCGVVLATRTTITSLGWIDRVFPGFVVLDNHVIASVSLAHWTGSSVVDLYQSEVVALDGQPVPRTQDLYRLVASAPAGTAHRYRVRKDGVERDVVVPSQRFTSQDWFLLFAPFLLTGAVYLVCGLVAWSLRPGVALPRALLVFGIACAIFFLTAMDLYGPATLFRLHVAGEALLPAAALQLALLLPAPHRWARWRLAGFGLSAVVLVAYEVFLTQPRAYSTVLGLNMTYLGMVGLFFAYRLVSEYWRDGSLLARQRARILLLGTLVGFTLPGLIVLASAFGGSDLGMNGAAVTPFLFALALAYAVVKHDLFEIDAMVKRGAYYLVLTGAVGAIYVAAVVLFDVVLRVGRVTDEPLFPVVFTLAVLMLFDPLRLRLQALVDRVFFRTTYNGPQALADIGAALGSVLQRDQLAQVVVSGIERAMPNGRTRLFVEEDGGLHEVGGAGRVPDVLARALRRGRVVTAFDASELYLDVAEHGAVQRAVVGLDAEIAVPLQLGDRLVGALTAGAKRSGLFYTAGDAEFLRAVAHQAAIALENARTYDAVVTLNAGLEERVRERTAQLQTTNQQLAQAYAELKNAEVQLVHSEKMASLGRLVAGVAHEINNPVSFIVTSVTPLQRRLGRAADAAPPSSAAFLREAQEIASVMARGAERTASIVKDLRSFSRLDEASRKAVDLAEGLEVSLRLLESRWRDRITVHRDYAPLPQVECDPGQLNQVFMNLLANACDAIPGRGNLWITTRTEDGVVRITIRDDGVGMPADVRARIFEPFFTTKDVGSGTGLGLAITHSVVAAHGGRITVESTPGAGARFEITLPVTHADDAQASVSATG